MMAKWLRENKYAAMLLLFVRLYLGYEWITAAWHKFTGGFDATGFLKNAAAKPIVDKATNELVYPTYTAFITNFALPNAKIFNVVIPIGEFLIGLGLILGCLTTAAAFFALLMNFMFLFAGTLNTNPWMVLIGGIVFMAGANAGRFGADYFVQPFLRKLFTHHNEANRTKGTGTRPTPAHL